RVGHAGKPARAHRGRGQPAHALLPSRQARRLRPYRRTRDQGRRPGGPAAEPRGYLQPLQREARPMTRILATADGEFRIALRNRWVAIALVLLAAVSLVLSLAGSAPSGGLGVDRLSVTVASLTSLAAYLVPLLALLMSFDAVAGEVERGTLPLLLTYPVSRAEVLLGKCLAHVAILALAGAAGYGRAVPVAGVLDRRAGAGLAAARRRGWSSGAR